MRLYSYNAGWWVQSILCYLLLIIIVRLSLGHEVMPSYLIQAVVITAAIFASSINPFQELHHDFNSGHLQQFMMLGVWRIIPGSVYLAVKLIIINLCFVIVQPITFLLLSVPRENYFPLFSATIMAVSYNLIITFLISCLNVGKQNNLLLMLLSLPLVIPGVLLSIMGIGQPSCWWLSLSVIAALLPLVVWMGEKVLLAVLSDG